VQQRTKSPYLVLTTSIFTALQSLSVVGKDSAVMTETVKQIVARLEDDLQGMHERLFAVELTIERDHYNQKHRQRLSKGKLAKRWSVSTRTVDRGREEDTDFPPAEQDRPGGPVFFWLDDVMRYERQRAARVHQLIPPKRTMEVARTALREQREQTTTPAGTEEIATS
jgi:hypothetical protein